MAHHSERKRQSSNVYVLTSMHKSEPKSSLNYSWTDFLKEIAQPTQNWLLLS